MIDVNERTAENSKILQVTNTQPQYHAEVPQSGKILPKQQEQGGQVSVTPKASEIPPTQTDEGNPPQLKHNTNEILSKEHDEVTDLVVMEEGARAQMPNKDTYSDSRKEYGLQGEKTYNRNHHR